MRLYQTIRKSITDRIRICIDIDIQNWQEILNYINASVEFAETVEILLNNLTNNEKYRVLEVSREHTGYYEILFSECRSDDRILCRQYRSKGIKDIILIKLFKEVRGEETTVRIINDIIEAGGYDYDIE